MSKAPDNPIVDIRTYLWQPDQPGSDKPDFVYKPGKFYRQFIITRKDGSGEIYLATKPEIDKTIPDEIFNEYMDKWLTAPPQERGKQ